MRHTACYHAAPRPWMSLPLIAVLLSWSGLAEATTYYVSTAAGAADTNTGLNPTGGAPNGPFLHVQQCFTVMKAKPQPITTGDICNIRAGSYTNQTFGYTRMRLQGTPSAYLTFQTYPPDLPARAKLDCTGTSDNCLNLNQDGRWFAPFNEMISYVIVQDLEITGSIYTGLKFNVLDHVIFRRNWIHHNAQGQLGGGTRLHFDRNLFQQNGTQGTNQGHQMYFFGSYNTFSNNVFDSQNGGYGIQMASAAYDTSTHPSVDYSGWSHNLIANNTFAYNTERPGLVHDRKTYGVPYYLPDGSYNPSPTPTPGPYYYFNTIVNNIFFQMAYLNTPINPPPYAGNGGAITWYYLNNGQNATVTNNVFYGSGSTGIPDDNDALCTPGCTINWSGSPSPTTTNPNMVNAPPVLARPATPDYHLTASSTVAIEKGLNLTGTTLGAGVAVDTDYDGVTRTVPWDIGAYEFSSAGEPPPPVTPPSPRFAPGINLRRASWPSDY